MSHDYPRPKVGPVTYGHPAQPVEQPLPAAPKPTEEAPVLPPAGEPSPIHYPDHREPTQHEPGAHIKPPESHEPWEHAESLAELLRAVRELRRRRRHWWDDALWPEHERELVRYQHLIMIEAERGPLSPEIGEDLIHLRFYLGLPIRHALPSHVEDRVLGPIDTNAIEPLPNWPGRWEG